MWEATVRVEREQLVDALPEKVWELAGSPAALSVLPGWFAFAVPGAVAGTDRLHCLLVSRGGFRRPVVGISRVDTVLIGVREEIPGEAISWQALNAEPAGKQVFTLSVHPKADRSAVRFAVRDVVPRGLKADCRSYWRHHAKVWLGDLRAVAEGRAPWPQPVMSAAMRQAMTAPVSLREPMEASAAVVVDGAPSAVWEAVWDPASARLIDPERVAWSGHVPGTPVREVGEMQYFVRRLPGGRLRASVCTVTELAYGHRAVTRCMCGRHETVHVITPVPGGTRLELTERWPARAMPGGVGARALLEKIRAEQRQTAEGLRALIEGRAPVAGPPEADGADSA